MNMQEKILPGEFLLKKLRWKRHPEKTLLRFVCVCMVLLLAVGTVRLQAYASEITDEAVLAVIAQLESIDSLQQMQDKRSSYTVSGRYDPGSTNTAMAAEHEAARSGYETYVSEMFAARAAARQAYNALSESQKALIDPALVEKLSNDLPTVLNISTCAVTPREDEYSFEAVEGGFGYAYEVSNYMVSGNIPQTFVLVDTSDAQTTWTPSGRYVYGESNYDLTYCCDVLTGLEYTTHYRRVNLEDGGYYSEEAARHIRAILQNAYPYITVDEMKANLKAGGLSGDFVDSLSRADLIAAVQMAVWTYANAADGAAGGLGYFASVDVKRNTNIYFYPLHDYTNECWEWFPGARQRSYDARAEYRVNTLAYYLCNLPGVSAREDQIVISDVEVTRTDLLAETEDSYQLGMYVYLNNGGTVHDDLTVTVTSYHTNTDGTVETTGRSSRKVNGDAKLDMTVGAKSGDTIHVVVEGTQYLEKGVYFYEPEGGRDVSQSLVGVAEGETHVRAEETFVFSEEVGETGLRIYKTETGTGRPLSAITFKIYNAEPADGVVLNETPTQEEIAQFATEQNLAGSVTTDETGYASIALPEGSYLVVEEMNAEKIKAPIHPFYLLIPAAEILENEDGTTTVQTVPVVSVYPKNEPVTPPEEPPILPPVPNRVTGSFQIRKYDEIDESILLEGAKFKVFRAAADDDTGTETIRCNGIQYAVVPVTADGENLVLTTDRNGCAVSPELSCGTYFLVETEAPAGYNLPEEAFRVTVHSGEMTQTAIVEIPNRRGNILPETGGMGTGVFFCAGIVLMLTSGALLILKKRQGG